MTRGFLSRLTLAVASCGVVLAAVPASAEYGPGLGLDELVAYSVAVVRGSVYSVDSAWDPGADNIYTYVRLDVAEVLQGAVPHRRIILKQLGGVVGELGQYVGGQAAFRPGEDVVVFLEARPRDTTVYTTALWQGKWTVAGDPGVEMLRRNAGFDVDGTEILPEELPLAVVRDAIGAGLRPAARSPETLQFLPPEAPRPSNTVDAPRAYKIPFLGFSWHEAFSGSTVPFHFHRARQRGVGKGKKQLRNAIETWTDVKRTTDVQRLGRRRGGAAPGSSLRDPQGVQDLLLQNNDPQGEISDTGGTLAVGGSWFFTNIQIRNLSMATSGYVIMNDGANVQDMLRDRTCYQNVLAHEVGHTTGLGHSNKSGNLMFPTISEGVCKAGLVKLGKDDQRFYRKIYHRKFARR